MCRWPHCENTYLFFLTKAAEIIPKQYYKSNKGNDKIV